MGKLFAALVGLALLASDASAQAQWVRITLNDGRTVDGQITGSDNANYFVQTQQGYFSILRANVTAITPMQTTTAQTAPTPPPPPPPPLGNTAGPVPVPGSPPADGGGMFAKKKSPLATAAGTYLLTAIIALARIEKDEDAKLGLIPIAGPMLWTSTDEDDFLEDGYDWLALSSTAIQSIGLMAHLFMGRSDSSSKVTVTPVTTQRYGGIAVTGAF